VVLSDQIKPFIRHGRSTCWIHTITIKYRYKVDGKNIKLKLKVHQDELLAVEIRYTVRDTGIVQF